MFPQQQWTLTINTLKCESRCWRRNFCCFLNRHLLWSAFSLCGDWDQIEVESRVDEGGSFVHMTCWRAAFHGARLGETGGDRGRPTALFRNIHFTVFVLFFVLFSLSSDQISDLIFTANFVKYKKITWFHYIHHFKARTWIIISSSIGVISVNIIPVFLHLTNSTLKHSNI